MSDNTTEKNRPEITLSREDLYNEIWELSLSGVAKKYGISYARLRKECADADIPVPPPGYWSQIEYGKEVVKTPLPKSKGVSINLSNNNASRRGNKKSLNSHSFTDLPKMLTAKFSQVKQSAVKAVKTDSVSVSNSAKPDIDLTPPETFTRWGQTYNVYDREVLYREVWQLPVTEVAKKYSVSDVTVHKICKSLDIPTPPPGYWAKLRAGKPVTIPLLPKNSAPDKKTGPRTDKPGISSDEWSGSLSFLQEEEREIVLSAAAQIWMSEENAELHPKLIAYKDAAIAWENNEKNIEASGWEQWQDKICPPFFWEELTLETQPRVYRIIDSLICAMEPLGCLLTDNLDFIVRGEKVSLSIKESKKKIVHTLTKQERKELLEYQEALKNGESAQKPSIRKYDYVYKGRLCLHVDHWKEFRDSSKVRLEERLGEILIGLYEASEIMRNERLEREEAQRLLEKEKRCREEGWENYNAEVEKTLALENEARDYDLACKIRTYVAAVESKCEPDNETSMWIEWAKAKADWYDPIIAREDDHLGKRKYKQSDADKILKKSDYHRYW